MTLKRTLTAVAVDSARDYVKERLQHLKTLDLDQDGQKDVDQVSELLVNVGEKLKLAIESTDFQKLGTGIEQVLAGATMIGSAADRDKLADACAESVVTLKQIGKLLKLGVSELRRQQK